MDGKDMRRAHILHTSAKLSIFTSRHKFQAIYFTAKTDVQRFGIKLGF